MRARPTQLAPALLALALTACGEPPSAEDLGVGIVSLLEDGEPRAVDLSELSFDRSGAPLAAAVRVDHLHADRRLDHAWPLDLRRAWRASETGGEAWPEDRVWFAPLLNGVRRSRLVRFGPDLAFLYVVGDDLVHGPGRSHPPVTLDAMDPMPDAVGAHFGAFDVAVLSGRLRVVYATKADAYGSPAEIRQVTGEVRDGAVVFGPPETVFALRGRVLDLQLVAGTARVDLVWRADLAVEYARLPAGAERWRDRRVLTETCRGHSVSLAAEGDRVWVAWSDERFARTFPFTQDNTQKLLLAHSADGGQSFGEPALLGSARDPEDRTEETFIAVAAGAPLLFARRDGTSPWDVFELAPDLATARRRAPVDPVALAEAWTAWARADLEGR